jgi:hypothetical protein
MNVGNLPSEEQLDAWNKRLLDDHELLGDLAVRKGWTTKTIKNLNIGVYGQWLIIPFCDWEQGVVNVMKYKHHRAVTDTGPKMLPYSRGHERSLYPVPRSWGPGSCVPGSTIFLVEGESDAITARSLGLNAVSVPGANGWKKKWVEAFWGLRVVLMFDHDEPGRKLTDRVAADLTERGIEVRVIDLATVNESGEPGFDVGDFVAGEIARHPDDDPEAVIRRIGKTIEEWADLAVPLEGKPAPAVQADRPIRATADLLDEVAKTIERFVVMPSSAALTAVSLWVLHTWTVEAAHATPYLLVISAEKRSGKTRLIEVLVPMVREPWATADSSVAAIFRKIEQDRPTMFLDEIDAIFSTQAERTEPLRAVVNAGNRRSGTVSRCVGESQDVRDFSVFCPKLLAGIDKGSKLPDTIRDRSLTISMVRRTSTEKVERLRPHRLDLELEGLRLDLDAWSSGAVSTLMDVEPDMPEELDDRGADAWEPLIALADLAGGDWPAMAREAAVALREEGEEDTVTNGALILGAIQELLGDRLTISSAEVVEHLNERDDLPFGGWRDGHGTDPRTLARLLKPYRVKPRKVRLPDGSIRQGYHRDDLEDAFARWLPVPEHSGEAEQKAPHGRADVPDVPDVPDISGGTLELVEGRAA